MTISENAATMPSIVKVITNSIKYSVVLQVNNGVGKYFLVVNIGGL
jgi:hypothetical protein